MSALLSRDTCFGYKQVSSRTWASTAVPVGLCIRLIIMCCYFCVPHSGLYSPTVCCRRMEVTLKQFCLVGHKTCWLQTFSLCKCFRLFLPFLLTNWQTHRDKLTSFPPEKSALTVSSSAELWLCNGKSCGSPTVFISDKRDCHPTVRYDAVLLFLL